MSMRSLRSSARPCTGSAWSHHHGPWPRMAVPATDFIAQLAVQQISRQLRFDEAVVRHVVVERLDHPVAINIRAREWHVAAILGIQAAHIVFGIARHIQPVTAPALAVTRRRKQPVDHLLERVGRLVVHERVHFLGRGRQAGQIQRGAADQCPPVRRQPPASCLWLRAWRAQNGRYLFSPRIFP